MKVFISQPMKDKTEEEIKAERSRVIKKIESEYPDAEIIDSFVENAPKDANAVWYLGESIKHLSEADAVYFVEQTNMSNGCIIEKLVCTLYGIEELPLEDE